MITKVEPIDVHWRIGVMVGETECTVIFVGTDNEIRFFDVPPGQGDSQPNDTMVERIKREAAAAIAYYQMTGTLAGFET